MLDRAASYIRNDLPSDKRMVARPRNSFAFDARDELEVIVIQPSNDLSFG
jgi:hypothetical protein